MNDLFGRALHRPQTLSGPLSGSGETIGHIVPSNELSHTNLFLFYAESRHKQNNKKKRQMTAELKESTRHTARYQFYVVRQLVNV